MTPEMQRIADKIRNDIETYAQNTYDDGHRKHLGASIIGNDCERYLYFTFRWVYHHIHTGRQYRLFNTGHMEEARIIGWLRGAGYDIINQDENGKQFKISSCNGHFGGSIDGIIEIPELGKCLFEAKTNKTGTDYKMYFESGMEKNKPVHWKQTCTYGNALGIENCLYICKNKDNDDLYIEPVKLDWNVGKEMEVKAKRVITAEELPPRISETAAYFKCKFCDYADICHRGKAIERNCRSCKNARAVENAEWKCREFSVIIPEDQIGLEQRCWKGVL